MKNLVIYHRNCPDGVCSAWIASKNLSSKDTEYVGAQYGDTELPDVKNKRVFILDFSYPRDVLIKMHEEAEQLIVIDHHKTAEENLKGLDFCTFDGNECGASLTYKYFYLDLALPTIVQYVKDRDLWKWELPHSKEISMATRFCGLKVPEDFEKWNKFAVRLEDSEDFMAEVSIGRIILKYNEMVVQQHISKAVSARTYLLRNQRELGFYIVNATVLFSEIAGELAKEADFGCCWFMREDGKYQYSLRSTVESGIDVSEVARNFDGGGHKNAAGFESISPPSSLFVI